jgi:hypothetical protein
MFAVSTSSLVQCLTHEETLESDCVYDLYFVVVPREHI